MTCPTDLELARAVDDGADPAVRAHLAACPVCAATCEQTQRAIDLARAVRVPMPGADRREELRTQILAAAHLAPVAPARGASRRRWVLGGAMLAAAATVALVLVRREPVAHAHAHGTVIGHAGARFATSTEAPDEIVTLHDGVIDVEVSKLHPGERFRVITADTEVEVRGTAFEVTAVLGHVTNVTVRHGRVEVRPHGAPSIVLGAGEAWTAPVRTAAVEPVAPPAPAIVAPTASPSPPVPPRPARGPSAPRPSIAAEPAARPPLARPTPVRPAHAIAYDEAWAAMRTNEFERAATTFARAALLDPDGPLAEDASYWYPVALARAKRTEAIGAFEDFLARYPRSVHAHEASAMLGWLLVDAKRPADAEARFRAAAEDPSPAVRESARAGLAALGVHGAAALVP